MTCPPASRDAAAAAPLVAATLARSARLEPLRALGSGVSEVSALASDVSRVRLKPLRGCNVKLIEAPAEKYAEEADGPCFAVSGKPPEDQEAHRKQKQVLKGLEGELAKAMRVSVHAFMRQENIEYYPSMPLSII